MISAFFTLTSDRLFDYHIGYGVILKLVISIYPLIGLQNAKN